MDMAALIEELADEGVERAFAWVRHGHRHYDAENLDNERFMGLTAEGKQAALELGRRLPPMSPVRMFSSSIGRCIETAYQVEKGCIERGVETRVNKLAGRLTGFFVRDQVRSLVHMREVGKDRFFRRWFAGELPPGLLGNADDAARLSCAYVRERLLELPSGLDVGISHDWNLYLLRGLCLGQHLEDVGEVGYLDGVVFFERDGALHGATPHGRGSITL